MARLLYSLAGAVLLALSYILGKQLHVDRLHHRRRWISFGAGASVAYVFVDLLPELSARQIAFMETMDKHNLPFPEFWVYMATLVGFLVFYVIDHVATGREESSTIYRLHICGFAAYSFLLGYLVVHRLAGLLMLVLYCIAITFHLLVIDHSLQEDYGSKYDISGKWILAASVLAGWATGILSGLPETLLVTLWGVVSGGVVLNSLKDELPGKNDARYEAFTIGALAYALLVLSSG